MDFMWNNNENFLRIEFSILFLSDLNNNLILFF